MKKLVVLPFLFLLIAGCNLLTPENKSPIEMIAFNSLSKTEQGLIQVSPKDSTIKREVVSEEIKALIGSDYEGEQVFSVVFNNTASKTSGNLIVFVDTDNKKVVGKGYQDKE